MKEKVYVITGVSGGIGKAIVNRLLLEGSTVIGIGRRNGIAESDRYTFIPCDLSDLESLRSIDLPFLGDQVVLINNAGILGVVDRISGNSSIDYELIFNTNTIAPLLLMKKIYKAIENKNNFTLVNISSGAAKNAIPSWAGYCASKAAMNMWTDCFIKEERENGFSPKVYCVAPGVVDTQMQDEIRSTDSSRFSSLDRFVALKEQNNLFSPEEVASRLLHLLSLPKESHEIFFDLREVITG